MEQIIPISRAKSLKEQAYEKLKELIITGALEPGELHNEKRLAEALGVSRTPVREALLELSRESMVAFVPGKGVEICKFTTEQVREVFEIRRIIEGYIIKKIATNSSMPTTKKTFETEAIPPIMIKIKSDPSNIKFLSFFLI